jgi:hypothetical protein
MSAAQPTPGSNDELAGLVRTVRTLHRLVLGLLASCALVAALGADRDSAADVPPREYTLAAVGLAVGVVVARRLATSPVLGTRARARLSIASLAFAAALGLVAATMALRDGALQSALVFVLAAGIFVMRPPRVSPGA